MKDRVLITGGAGFIGTRLARRLIEAGQEVSILDNFSPQIHGHNGSLAPDLAGRVRLFRGDIRDAAICRSSLESQTVLVHLAAETGTGQSMYNVRRYTDVNIAGTSNLMEVLLTKEFPVHSIIVASSRAVYGEGAGQCPTHGIVYPSARSKQDMETRKFEPRCPVCSQPTTAVPTPEDAPLHPSSVYGITKQVQEQLTLMYANALGINGFALRYQNVYGPGQSLKNPYCGILTIFSNQARANRPIHVFEDGRESRDFVHVDDVVDVTLRCIQAQPQRPVALNVGTGTAVTVSDVVKHTLEYFSSSSQVTVTGSFREGDIRHNIADVRRLRTTLGVVPVMDFQRGIQDFLAWSSTQPLHESNYEQSLVEMRQTGLMHG